MIKLRTCSQKSYLGYSSYSTFLPLMFENLIETRDFDQIVCLNKELFVAAEKWHVEYITHLCRASSFALTLIRNQKGQNLFQVAAECHQHKVYNLIHALDDSDQSDVVKFTKMKRSEVVGLVDKFGNNMLHTVGSISSMTLSTINHIRGAALQMQRELQWFKYMLLLTNSHCQITIIVGALIVTMMFAAAFTVPGGNNGDTGLPTFLSQKVFTTFIVSDAVSLFSSTTLVIMFLGILTSRYSEDDFLKSLPTKMIIGLFTLFLSIATMMIAFSCALYMMLDGKKVIVIPSILLASVPVASFIWMQFPFLAELLISTFGPGIFDRNQEKLF
ncbi:hypothetical protein D8674_035995 [Pyrus ussuriensis x Pyrus communis]|uniref:PGG domain-containing protein n=1 Tax=Pyrus ussuriensis x Pyrus communis TaxID=2448454 RepID=A0A5N5GDX5_9ROSA|nr:hypothetical protein D8674_035995 [Pyrus ussuriensis x Pyrus communis]